MRLIVTFGSSSILPGATTQAYCKDSLGRLQDASWASSDTTIATVNEEGLVRAMKTGSITITAHKGVDIASATFTVKPPVPVANVVVSPSSATLIVGTTQALTVTLTDAAGNVLTGRIVTWSSANDTAVAVNSSGNITGVSAGSALVTASAEGKSGTCSVTCQLPAPIVSQIELSPSPVSVEVGKVQQINATVKDQYGNVMTGQTVTWSSSATSVASVNTAGLVSGMAVGTATISVQCRTVIQTLPVTVTTAPVSIPTTLTVAPTSVSGLVGTLATLVGTVKDQNGNIIPGATVTFSSADTTIASVSGAIVSLLAAGSTTIAAASGSLTASVSVTVTAPVVLVPTTLTVSPTTISGIVGTNTSLVITVKDQNGTVMNGQTAAITSLNAAVATISGQVVTLVGAGSTSVTVKVATLTNSVSVTATAPVPVPDVLFSEGFEDGNVSARGWYDNTTISRSTTEHTGNSVASLQYHWAVGATTPTSGGAIRKLFTPSDSVRLSYDVKYSANWVGSGQLYHPHEFIFLSNLDDQWAGPSDAFLAAYVESLYQNGGKPRMSLQDNKSINTSSLPLPHTVAGENRSVCGCNGMSEPNMPSECFTYSTTAGYYNLKGIIGPVTFNNTTGSPGYKNSWNKIDAFFKMNSVVNGIGQADGVMRYWFNDQLVIDRTDVIFRTGQHPTMQFNQFMIAPYIGDGSPVDQSMWIDNLVIGTKPPVPTPVPVPQPVATVVVSVPSSVENGKTVQAVAVLKDAAGNVLTGRAVTWTAGSLTGVGSATVSSTGLVTGTAEGDVLVSAISEGKSGSATVTVTAAAPAPVPVASVIVSLASPSVQAGLTTQATAVAMDSVGNVLTGRPVTWASNNTAVATVSSTGLVTAVSAGSAAINATSEGKTGTAPLTVTAAPIPTNPWIHQPAGYTKIVERPFNALSENGWYDDNAPSKYSIVQDATAPYSPSNVGQQIFPAGFSGGGSPAVAEKGLGGKSSIYLAYMYKISANWQGHSSGVNKQIFAWTDNEPAIYTTAQGSGSGGLRPEVHTQGSGGTVNWEPNLVPGVLFTRGVWHKWEILMTVNSSGQSNGLLDFWLDDVKIGSYNNVRYNSGSGVWELFQLSPIWGGNGDSVKQTQYCWIDHLYISGK